MKYTLILGSDVQSTWNFNLYLSTTVRLKPYNVVNWQKYALCAHIPSEVCIHTFTYMHT